MGRSSKAAKNATKEVSIDYATFDAVEQERYNDMSSISDPSCNAGRARVRDSNGGRGIVDIRPINKLDYKIDSDDNGDKDWPGAKTLTIKATSSPPLVSSALQSTPPSKSKSRSNKMKSPGTGSKDKKPSSSSSGWGWFGNSSTSYYSSNSRQYGHRRNDSTGVASTASFSQSEDFQRIFDDDDNSDDGVNGKYSEVYSVGKRSPPKGKGSTSQGSDYYAYTEDAYDVDDGTSPNKKNPEKEIYFVSQRYGYCSIVFSLCQTGVLVIMMVNCGVAPFNINPMIGPYPDALSEWGAKNAVNILQDGEWYRLITPIMLHAGIIHLLCNVAVQVETGAFFEREWGSKNWLIIYLSSAVGSSILSVIFMPDAISVGSSGAVMGLFGGKLAEIICRFCESKTTNQERIGHQVRKEQCAAVLCSVTVVMLFSFIPYVDWAAHLGGVIAGLCVGLIIFGLEITTSVWKTFWFLIGLVCTTAYFAVTLQHMYSGEIEPIEELRDVCGYYKEYFEDYECNCMREEQEGGGNSGD